MKQKKTVKTKQDVVPAVQPLLLGKFSVSKTPLRLAVLFSSIIILLYSFYLAYTVRFQPVKRFGYIIHEFDPWFQYRATKYLSDHGWYAFFHWYDRMSWYPLGRPVGGTIYPGLQITAVAIHRALQWVGYPLSLQHVCVLIPAWFGVICTFFTALLAYELSFSLSTAAITAFLYCIIPAHTMRSMAGKFDNECIALSAMMATFYFWVRSLRTPSSWPIGIMAGLAYGYMVAAWGGFVFVLNLVALHAGVMALVDWSRNSYNPSLLKAYALFFVIGTAIATRVPPVALLPFRSLEQMSAIVVLLFLIGLHISETQRRKQNAKVLSWTCLRIRCYVFTCMGVSLLAIMVALIPSGFLEPVTVRVRALFVRHTRTGNPLVDSVAEHRPADEKAFMSFLGFCSRLWPFGVVALLVPPLTSLPSRVFVICFSVTSFYFSQKMSRLLLLAGPPATVATGFLMGSVVDSAAKSLFWVSNSTSISGKNSKKAKATANDSIVVLAKDPQKYVRRHYPVRWCVLNVLFFAGVLYLLFFTSFAVKNRRRANEGLHPYVVFEAGVSDSSSPTGRKKILVTDYLDSYLWLKEATPQDARVLAWWDYGYQITGIAERTTLADGNTWNHEQIAVIGKMLTSPVETAHSLVRHVADYVLIWAGQLADDLKKSTHMARIGNSIFGDICPDDPQCRNFGFSDAAFQYPSSSMRNSLLYHLHTAGIVSEVTMPPNTFQLVHTSKHGLVRIYKVLNVSEESKAWVADPTNRVCSEEHSWVCVGQFPPAKEIQDLISKIVPFPT